MSTFTGTNDLVNGGTKGGDFFAGKTDFFTIATIIPMAQTNVTTPVSLLYTQQGYSTWQSVSVTDGAGTVQTYASQSAYQDALVKQQNLDLLVRLFATRVSPIAMSVTVGSSTNPAAIGLTGYSYSTNFGSGYTTNPTPVTYVKFMTDKTGMWLVSGSAAGADTNAVGYQLLDTLQGVVVQDLATPVLNSSFLFFETLNSTNRNTIAVFSATL